jgi:hypothetical protein
MVMKEHIVSRIAIFILAIAMIVFGIQHFIHPYDLLVKFPDFFARRNSLCLNCGKRFYFSGYFLHDQHLGENRSLPVGPDAI